MSVRGPAIAGLLGLVALASLAPAVAEAKLTKPERRAVDIRTVTGSSTSTAALVEIRFAGNLEDSLGRGALRKAHVTVALTTASGQATVITERGTDRRPRRSRTGTAGSFQMVRDEAGLLLLVEGLTEPVRQATVSTGTGAAAAADEVPSDQVIVPIGGLDFQQALNAERERVAKEIERTERQIENYEGTIKVVREEMERWHERWMEAEGAAERAHARERFEFEKRLLQKLIDEQGERRKDLGALRRWQEIIGQVKIIVILPLN